MTHRIAITPGEPAGIGPDLVLELTKQDWPVELVLCADPELILSRAKVLGKTIELIEYNPSIPAQPQRAGTLTIASMQMVVPAEPGKLDETNGRYVLDTLQFACEKNMSAEFSAVVTGPVNKGIINKAGVSFSGHTEFFCATIRNSRCGNATCNNWITSGISDHTYSFSICSQGHHRRTVE